MAEPAYSMTWPVPPAVPMVPISARIRSLALTPNERAPSTVTRMLRGAPRDQGLRGQHMLDFRGADAESERAKGAVRRGVAVAAHHRHAGLGISLLRADDVHDALADIGHGEVRDAELAHVALQASRPDGATADRRCRRCDPSSARCGRRRRWWRAAGAPCGPLRAARRRPAGSSPRGRDGSRCRAAPCRPPAPRRRGCPRSCRTACAARSWLSLRLG